MEKKRHVSSDSDDGSSSDSSGSSGSSGRSSSNNSTSSSEYSRRKRHGKHSRGKRRKRGSHSKRKRSSSSSSSSSSASGGGDNKSACKSSDKETVVEKQMHVSSSSALDDDDTPPIINRQQDQLDEEDLREAREFKKAVQGSENDSDSEDDDMGPMPLVNQESNAAASNNQSQKAYGKALLPGEGEALAAYVQQNLRIPRRGEIGYDADEIDHYEKSGYVMSGSRHARMNAVRIRKENQVYSAEEQRALALITLEEKQQKEAALMNDFRTMLKEKQSKMTHAKGKEEDE